MTSTITLSPEIVSFPAQRRILIVDDEPAILAPAARYFRRLAFRVDAAESSRAATDLLAIGRYDAAIVDLRLSPADPYGGACVVSNVRLRCPAAPVIVLSGFVSEEAECELRGMGADVLRKPQPLPELADLLMRKLGLVA